MNEDLIKRIETALTKLEDMENRVSVIVEGQRAQASHLIAELKLPELRHELRQIVRALMK